MKKKLLSALLAALLVLSMIPFAFARTVAATEPGNVAYLDEANGDDETAELNNASAPYGTFKAAYDALCPEGGTLKFIAPYTDSATGITGLAKHYGTITITADGNTDNYWQPSTAVKFSGNVVIENIRFATDATTVFYANYNHLTMGEGLSMMKGTTVVTAGADSPFYLGGGTIGNDRSLDTHITVKSGAWKWVFGGNRNGQIVNEIDMNVVANKCASLGTCFITIEGGDIATLSGVNWHSKDILNPGGQAYIYIKNGTIGQIYFGGDTDRRQALEDTIVIWTGGTIGTGNLKALRCASAMSLFYGGDVTMNAPYSPNSFIDGTAAAQPNIFTSNGVSTGIIKHNTAKLNVLPLRTSTDTTVYVSQATGTYYNPGTQEAPVSSLANAYAMLTYTGGTIVLLDDYTFTANELTMYRRFNEPIHEYPILVKGNTADVKVIGPKTISAEAKVNTLMYDISTGFNAWYLHGDTAFEDLVFDFEDIGECNIVANFNTLRIGNGVTCQSLRLVGGSYVQGVSYHKTPYRSYGTAYANGYDEACANWSDKSPAIEVDSETAQVWIAAFSRLMTGGEAIHYPGTADIKVLSGAVSDLYPTPTNRRNATAFGAYVDLHDATVNQIHDGGHASGYGEITDTLDITVGENVRIKKYHNVNTAPATFEMKVNNAWSSYLIAKNTYTQANVTTDITADTYRDSIDTVLGFALKDNGDDGVKIRYGVQLKDYIIDDENFQVKEFGVLVKSANNAAALEWFEGSEQVNYQSKVAKNAAYIRGTEIKNYHYDPEAGTNDVEYYSTLSNLSEAKYENSYVFRPYMVVTVNGEDQVVYGAQETRSAYTIAQALGSTNETAAKVLTAVDGAEG